MPRQTLPLLLFLAWLSCLACNKGANNSISTTSATNTKAAQAKPYLFLISLDGFRWDYVERFQPPNLSAFIKGGVQAESLISSFPTKTFPNHYTIATGMYPDKHGILANNFYSYEKDVTYKIRNKELVEDGSFYSGTPIWIQAANAGMCTASYFFVGSEANIQGQYPTYYYKFDKSVASETRVAQALDWLALPEKTRPHMITMYFSDLDDIGHRVGPNDDEKIKEVLFELDEQLGKLLKGIAATGLPVNTVFVSDHGMLEVPLEKYIPVEKLHKDEWYSVVNNGTIASIHPQEGISVDSIYAYLKTKEDRFKVYKTADTPFFEYQPTNKNWGALQVIPDAGYYFNEIRYIGYKKTSGQKVFGHHGFDPELKEMHGIFYANGPAFKNGYVTPSVKNIHIYPLMCEILGLDIPTDIDGELEQLEDVLEK